MLLMLVLAADPEVKPVPLHEHPTIVEMWKASNQLRLGQRLAAHRLDPQLCQAAQSHAVYMASTGRFDHFAGGSSPSSRAARFGFRGVAWRENIGWNYQTVPSVFQGWRSSQGHWAAIISQDTTDAGFGYAIGANGQPYWVAMYGAVAKQ
jgi:uncharacterized protein YkwD